MRRGTIALVGSLVVAVLVIAGAADYLHVKDQRCSGYGGVLGAGSTCGHVNARASAHGWAWAGGVLAALVVTGGLAAAATPRPASAPRRPFLRSEASAAHVWRRPEDDDERGAEAVNGSVDVNDPVEVTTDNDGSIRDVIDARYARGEITRDDFLQMKADLGLD
jgi:hypothetical protein